MSVIQIIDGVPMVFPPESGSSTDNELDQVEWQRCYEKCFGHGPHFVNVLLVVDVQNDSRSLAIKGCGSDLSGKDVIKPINHLLENGHWDKVIYVLDWHPEDHISFYDNLHMRRLHPESEITKDRAKTFDTVRFWRPLVEQKLWPRHCVMGSWAAELHKDLIIVPNSEEIRKGRDPNWDDKSPFAKGDSCSELSVLLRRINATDIYVCGLVNDVCLNAINVQTFFLGCGLMVIDDCCRRYDLDDTAKKREITKGHVFFASSDEVLSFVNEKKPNFRIAEHLSIRARRHPV